MIILKYNGIMFNLTVGDRVSIDSTWNLYEILEISCNTKQFKIMSDYKYKWYDFSDINTLRTYDNFIRKYYTEADKKCLLESKILNRDKLNKEISELEEELKIIKS